MSSIFYLYTGYIVLYILPQVALRLDHLRHEDLLHLPVVKVVQVPDGVLGPGDEVQQHCPDRDTGNKLMLKHDTIIIRSNRYLIVYSS